MLLLLLQLFAQAAQGRPAFKSSSELVVLHVAVVDRHAGFVSGLPRDVFSVYEDDRPQAIAFFENEDTPVSVGLVIDSSGSMLRRRDAVIAAGMAFAESSHPDDEMFTICFNEKIWRGLPDGQAFTSDHQELHAALNKTGARGQTALFDAIDAGLRQLDRQRQSCELQNRTRRSPATRRRHLHRRHLRQRRRRRQAGSAARSLVGHRRRGLLSADDRQGAAGAGTHRTRYPQQLHPGLRSAARRRSGGPPPKDPRHPALAGWTQARRQGAIGLRERSCGGAG